MDGPEAGREWGTGHRCRSAGCASGDRSGLWACCRGRGLPGFPASWSCTQGRGRGPVQRSGGTACEMLGSLPCCCLLTLTPAGLSSLPRALSRGLVSGPGAPEPAGALGHHRGCGDACADPRRGELSGLTPTSRSVPSPRLPRLPERVSRGCGRPPPSRGTRLGMLFFFQELLLLSLILSVFHHFCVYLDCNLEAYLPSLHSVAKGVSWVGGGVAPPAQLADTGSLSSRVATFPPKCRFRFVAHDLHFRREET